MPGARDRDPHLMAIDSYEDVTADFERAAAAMSPSQLAKAPLFQLADSLFAFEIGNPKMDNGMDYVPFLEQRARAPAVETVEDFLQIVDKLVCMEMAWHRGSSPVETLFSCIYLEELLLEVTRKRGSSTDTHEMPDVESYLDKQLASVNSWADVLRVYLLAVIKTMGVINELIEAKGYAVVFAEEDFFPINCSFYLLDYTPVGTILALLEKAVKFANGNPAAVERLSIRLSWLNIVRQRVTKKPVHLDAALKCLDVYTDSYVENFTGAKFDSVFSDKIQTRVPCGCVSHPLVYIDLKDAVEQWKSMIVAIKDLATVFSIEKSADMLGYFLVFSTHNHLPLVRAMAKSLFGERELLGQSAKLWVLKDISEISFPEAAEAVKKNKQLDTFTGQAMLCYLDLLTVFCQNRCRMREGLAACVLSFDSLQISADQADRLLIKSGGGRQLQPHQPSSESMWALEFSSWTYFRKLQIMLWIVLMAFETDIVRQEEYASTYWYCVQLSQHLLDQLSRLKTYFEQNNLRSKYGASHGYLVALELEAQTLSQLCTAQYLLWTALQKQGFVKTITFSDPEHLRYKLRFAAFESIGVPEQCQIEDFNTVDKDLTVEVALRGAGNAARGARSLLATLSKLASENKEMELLKRSALGLGIAVSSAIKATEPGTLEIQRTGYHWYFPVPKLP